MAFDRSAVLEQDDPLVANGRPRCQRCPATASSCLMLDCKVPNPLAHRVAIASAVDIVGAAANVRKARIPDRRRRLLELTVKGHHLEKRLTEKQSRRIAEAYQAAGASSVSGFCQVLLSIIDESDRHRVAVQERAGDGSTNQRRFG